MLHAPESAGMKQGREPQRQRRTLADPRRIYHLARLKARGRGGGGDDQRRRPSGPGRMRSLSPAMARAWRAWSRRSRLARRPSRQASTATGLQALLPPGAARNALDCALWDLEAKIAGGARPSLPALRRCTPVETAFTISLASPEDMAAQRAGSGALSPAQAQAWRRWRRGAACRRPRSRARCAAHRRCQRGVARVTTSSACSQRRRRRASS